MSHANITDIIFNNDICHMHKCELLSDAALCLAQHRNVNLEQIRDDLKEKINIDINNIDGDVSVLLAYYYLENFCTRKIVR